MFYLTVVIISCFNMIVKVFSVIFSCFRMIYFNVYFTVLFCTHRAVPGRYRLGIPGQPPGASECRVVRNKKKDEIYNVLS